MSKLWKSVIPATILGCGLLLAYVTPSEAKPEYATKESKSCTFCHVELGKPDLNAAGKYYAAHDHSLEGYKPASK